MNCGCGFRILCHGCAKTSVEKWSYIRSYLWHSNYSAIQIPEKCCKFPAFEGELKAFFQWLPSYSKLVVASISNYQKCLIEHINAWRKWLSFLDSIFIFNNFQIPLNFVSECPIDNKSAMMVSLLRHICITLTQMSWHWKKTFHIKTKRWKAGYFVVRCTYQYWFYP